MVQKTSKYVRTRCRHIVNTLNIVSHNDLVAFVRVLRLLGVFRVRLPHFYCRNRV